MYDAIVIGGGPAGLQATLTLSRLHRPTLLVDSGSYRNDPAHAMHNVVTHDGTPPSEFRAVARKELAAYDTAEVLDEEVATVAAEDGGFVVTTTSGSSYSSRKVVLATGLRDTMPEIPGLQDLWGTVAAQCPFCHGHEFSGRVVAIQGGPHAPRVAAMLSRVAREVVVVAHDHELTDVERAQVAHVGASVREGLVTSARRDGDGAVLEVGGDDLRVDGFFVAATYSQAAPFADQLGLALLPDGCVEIDAFARTSIPGVLAGGDLAHEASHPMSMAAVVRAVSAGLLAGSMAVQELVEADLAGATA
jgi:thioredoxin reductase